MLSEVVDFHLGASFLCCHGPKISSSCLWVSLGNTSKALAAVQVRDDSGWGWDDDDRDGKKWAY